MNGEKQTLIYENKMSFYLSWNVKTILLVQGLVLELLNFSPQLKAKQTFKIDLSLTLMRVKACFKCISVPWLP